MPSDPTPERDQLSSLTEANVWLSADRSVLAFTKVGVALVAIGFTANRLMGAIRASAPAQPASPEAGRLFALIFVGVGSLLLVASAAAYWRARKLYRMPEDYAPFRLAVWSTGLLGLGGLLLFVDILFNLQLF